METVFDDIADHFDATRSRPWSHVVDFIVNHPGSGTALDLGSGNGRHIPYLVNAGYTPVALDLSRNLLFISTRHTDLLIQGHGAYIPIKSESVSMLLAIAVLHHLNSREERIAMLTEIVRVLKPGRWAVISVWAPPDKVGTGEAYVPWHYRDGGVFNRYYYFYSQEELESDLETVSIPIKWWNIFTKHKNIWVELKR